MQKSDSIAALAAALCKAQATMKAAIKDSSNPFFNSKYADLTSIIEASKEPLSDNDLAFVQTTDLAEPANSTFCVTVETVLMHSSGEWIMGKLRMPCPKTDPQSVGSAITYARRYGLQAIIGLPTDDDDGNAASQPEAAPASPSAAPKSSLPTAGHRITVKSVSVKEGEGAKGPWGRTTVESTSGERYSTFDKKLSALCVGLEGKDCYVEFTDDGKYKTLKGIEVA